MLNQRPANEAELRKLSYTEGIEFKPSDYNEFAVTVFPDFFGKGDNFVLQVGKDLGADADIWAYRDKEGSEYMIHLDPGHELCVWQPSHHA